MKKKVWMFLCVAAAVGCVGSTAYAIHYKANAIRGQEMYEELRAAKKDMSDTVSASAKEEVLVASSEQVSTDGADSTVTPTVEPTIVPTATPSLQPSPTPTVPPIEIPIDFESLQQQNPDIYAWITIPGTKVDYPVLQNSTDDSFYMHHGVDGSDLFAGAIYSEMQNSKDFSDFNTVLYGHNMKDGSMFATLHWFQDREFFDNNREMIVYTPEQILHYEIFGAYTYDDRHILNSFDFKKKKSRRQYLDEVYNIRAMDAFFLEEPKAEVKDKILTLSTCVGNNASARYLVQGLLTEVEG